MGLMQRCVDTYNAMEHLVGVQVEGKQTLAPIGHIIANAEIVITIDSDGTFVSAEEISQKAIIPCTEDSASRSGSKVAPHPLCDQLCYVSGEDADKYNAYIEKLETWINAGCKNEKLLAVFSYVKRKEVLKDLQQSELKKYNDKSLIVWRVIGLGLFNGTVCSDTSLQRDYSAYYLSHLSEENVNGEDYCMVSGENAIVTSRHLKGVVAFNGNAKIISSNDSTNFTYRGRFQTAEEACSIGYISSQKAHNALKWVVANEGVFLGGRACVCWNPEGNKIPKMDMPIVLNEEKVVSPTAYKQLIHEKALGYKRDLPVGKGVVVAMFDAATAGRLSVTYYNELNGSDFVDRLASWDNSTCFPSSYYGIQTPRLSDYVNFAYGTYRGEYFDADERIFKQHMQRMLIIRVDNRRMPEDIVRRLVDNSSRLSIYNKTTRDKLLHTTCAAIKKRYIDIYKEEWPMALETEKKDRSYQYGRLLAVLEKMESDTYGDSEKKRETNAIRSQHMFVQRPQTGFAWIMGKLQQSYIRKLSESSRVYYDKLIQDIVNTISECEEETNKPLSETYLMGYYLQKQSFYTKKNEETINED